jgi:hypothetical protein
MERLIMSPRRTAFLIVPLALGISAACHSEPKLQVENAPAATADSGQQSTADAPALQAAHAPTAAAMGSAPPIQPGAQMPPNHPPIDGGSSGMTLPPVDPNLGRGETGLAWTAPAQWVAEPPSNSMRRAQYRVPGPGGDGELVVFYFGPGQGGGPMENAQRWAGQFQQPDGKDPLTALKTRAAKAGDAPMLLVETTGTYLSGSMMGGAAEAKPDWALLGAVIQGPDSNWFFKLTGPRTTIEAARPAFDGFVASVHPGA